MIVNHKEGRRARVVQHYSCILDPLILPIDVLDPY